ncbi:MAG: NAD(P)/FAD-dependent oxidoreductase [Spirochaeta sp.]
MYLQIGPDNPLTVDAAVIGAGVSGAAIARELSRYQLDTVLIEKSADVCFGTSKANSGIIHGGFHHNAKYLKTRLEIRGNLMFDHLQRELDFPFQRCGILVAAMQEEQLKHIEYLYQQGVDNGAIGIEMCSRDRMQELEPKIHPDVVGGLHAPGGGIIEPYRFGFALVESAQKNGVQVVTGFEVVRGEQTTLPAGAVTESETGYHLYSGNGGRITARYVINAAGVYADRVSRILNAEEFTIIPRKGEYLLLDRWTASAPRRVLFPVPTQISKGMLVIPTVEGTVLIGPTADEIEDREDTATTADKLEQIIDSARRLVPSISGADIITGFAGLRPALADGDFYIDVSARAPHVIQVAGIQSPGLTASPAIGEYVKDKLKTAGCRLTEKQQYDPCLEKTPRLRDADTYAAEELIARDPAYCRVVCRCETVSEAEITAAIRKGHTTLDGVKFYSRAGMGRCQGGFCTHRIIQLIEQHAGIPYTTVSKQGPGSEIFVGELTGDSVPGENVGAAGRAVDDMDVEPDGSTQKKGNADE